LSSPGTREFSCLGFLLKKRSTQQMQRAEGNL
jgi:hypothetical protein